MNGDRPAGFSRRKLLISAGGSLLVAGTARMAGAACLAVPAQTEGPFYPRRLGEDTDWDLTHLGQGTERAQGVVIEVSGRLLDDVCRPVSGGTIEIWQADVQGRYHHPAAAGAPDEGRGQGADPNFQGFGRVTTDADGRYRFRTIKPAPYGLGGSFMRTPHIHFKALAPDGGALTTQMYFAGESLNGEDFILGNVPPDLRPMVIVDFAGQSADGVPRGIFDIVVG
ncbi:MAG: intradiol ring-cleavage dioxygenase [Rhodospirillaceae bacterium]|nr:intradiol ring-cleavage dioxygenase [Rhodospirillaceae bacterium]